MLDSLEKEKRKQRLLSLEIFARVSQVTIEVAFVLKCQGGMWPLVIDEK